MKMKSIYVTFDRVGDESGAGKVCQHEIEALKKASDLEQVITGDDVMPRLSKYYKFNPFLYDYFASDIARQAELAHLSCSPGMALLRKIKPKRSLVNVVAHDLKTSVEEHERLLGTPYPFIHNIDPYLFKCLLKHSAKCDVVLTPSERSAKWIRENLETKRIEVIPHGTYIPVNVKPIPREFKPGYLGVWGPDKGLIYLIMAWNKLEYKGIDFMMAGDCGKTLQSIIPKISNSSATYGILGHIPDIGVFYDSLSVYVQPSVTEGFGMPVLEAMSHGRPVIVTEGAGSSYLVEDGKEGFVIPIRSPKALAEKLRYFKDNRKDIRLMGKRARRKAKKYSWKRIEERYCRLYESLS